MKIYFRHHSFSVPTYLIIQIILCVLNNTQEKLREYYQRKNKTNHLN